MKKIFKLFQILALITLSTSISFAKNPPPGTGFQDVPTNVLIMLDTSGSMGWSVSTGNTDYPFGVAFDSAGNIFVAEYYDQIEKYDSSGSFQTYWGSYDYNGASDGYFRRIYGIAIDSNDLVYVSDAGRGRVQVFNTSGVFQSKFSLTTSSARGLAIDSNDNIYVANGNGDIEKFNTSGTRLATWSSVNGAYQVAVDSSDNVYVTKYYSRQILKYDSNGNLLQTINTTDTYSVYPFGVQVDSSGNIYFTDLSGDRIYQYDSSGNYVQRWGGYGSSLGNFKDPYGLGKDNSGNIWVADFYNDRIQSPTGTDLLSTSSSGTRLAQAKEVIKQIVSNSSLTDGANFGLMEWNSSASMVVPVSSTGAASIYSTVDSLSAGGGTYLDYAIDEAESYFLGSTSPMDSSAWCQNNLLIVISDGEWVDSTASTDAATLYNTYNIKTFVVGFLVSSSSSGATNYTTLSQQGGTYPDSPVFASNWQSLYESISNYILQVISSNLTFSAPTIMPEITGGDHILQATFKHKTDHQWKGHLNKYELESDGGIGDLVWDAGEVLAAKAAADRQIWTVGAGLSATDYNNFVTANLDDLRVGLLENAGTTLSDTELNSLIDFVRGVDSYSEFSGGVDDEGDTIITGERWKLADVYHSRAVIVGAPSAFTSEESDSKTESFYRFDNGYNTFKTGDAATRDTMVYVGSNGGMLHAFNSSDGDEAWAFIPPSLVPNLKDSISLTANESTSIYGVDASPTIKDIYYDGGWKTVLISGARQGGHTYFALDITDPAAPAHLFTFAHNTLNSQVSYWDASGARTDYSTSSTIASAYDFSDLGESWSQPVILRLPVGTSGLMKWTAVFGGGYNAAISSDYGAKLFIIDLENSGQIIQKIDIADDGSSNGIENSVPPRVTAITPDSSTFFQDSADPSGAVIFLSDLEGKMWKINLTDQGVLYEASKLFDAESTATNARLSFHQTAATVDYSENLMQFYGTGDSQSLGDVDSSITNRIYGLKNSSVMTNFPTSAMDTISDMADVASGVCPDTTQAGWYEDLDANEKVAAQATIYKGTVLFPRYTSDSSDICSAGTAKITEHEYTCGELERETDLGYGVPTQAIVYKNKIYLGISTDQTSATLPDGFEKEGNLIVGDPVTVSTGSVTIESWWEDF